MLSFVDSKADVFGCTVNKEQTKTMKFFNRIVPFSYRPLKSSMHVGMKIVQKREVR